MQMIILLQNCLEQIKEKSANIAEGCCRIGRTYRRGGGVMDTKALRQKILDLAIRGKLVPQDPNDEPASVFLERIREQKKQMVKEGKLKS